MKKRLLLAVLPAFLVLSACNPLSSYAAAGTKVNQFAEDTVAHEEVFGEAKEANYLKPSILKRDPGQDITAPKIGYQIHYESSTLAIRFVAAVKDLNVKAYWKRGVAGPDGNSINSKEFSDSAVEVTKYYTSLTAGEETITAGVAPYADYVGFVVYTIYGIPYNATNKKAYVAAYVSLVGDEDGEDDGAGGIYNAKANSVALAVSIERKTESASETELKNVFAFDPTTTGYFLEGTIGGVVRDGSDNSTHSLLRASSSDVTFVDAVYNSIALQSTDSFGSFYYSPSSFKFFGNSTFFDEASDYFDEASLAEFNSPKANGTQTLYVLGSSAGAENHVRVKKEVTLYLTNNWAWSVKAHVYNDVANTPKVAWPGENMATVGLNDDNDIIYNYTVDIALYDRIIFNNNGSESDKTAAVDISDAAQNDAYYFENVDYHNEAIKWGTYNGLTSKMIIYVTNNVGWETVKYHAYSSSTSVSEAAWPGKAGKWTANNEYSQGVYRILVDTSAFDTIIFNNGYSGGNNQSVSIPISAFVDGKNAVYFDGVDGSGNRQYVAWQYNDPVLP